MRWLANCTDWRRQQPRFLRRVAHAAPISRSRAQLAFKLGRDVLAGRAANAAIVLTTGRGAPRALAANTAQSTCGAGFAPCPVLLLLHACVRCRSTARCPVVGAKHSARAASSNLGVVAKDWYDAKGIPHYCGAMFHGSPGSTPRPPREGSSSPRQSHNPTRATVSRPPPPARAPNIGSSRCAVEARSTQTVGRRKRSRPG